MLPHSSITATSERTPPAVHLDTHTDANPTHSPAAAFPGHYQMKVVAPAPAPPAAAPQPAMNAAITRSAHLRGPQGPLQMKGSRRSPLLADVGASNLQPTIGRVREPVIPRTNAPSDPFVSATTGDPSQQHPPAVESNTHVFTHHPRATADRSYDHACALPPGGHQRDSAHRCLLRCHRLREHRQPARCHRQARCRSAPALRPHRHRIASHHRGRLLKRPPGQRRSRLSHAPRPADIAPTRCYQRSLGLPMPDSRLARAAITLRGSASVFHGR